MTEQQHCPKCGESIPEGVKKCSSCGMGMPICDDKKGAVPTKVLWAAAILICFGIVCVATLVLYVSVKGFGDVKWRTFHSKKHEPAASSIEMPIESDIGIYITPDDIENAMGDDPEDWVAQQAGKKFIVTGPLIELTPSDDGQALMAQIGRGVGACYVFILDPAVFDEMEQIVAENEICMSGVCMTFSDEPQAFVLINGQLEE